VPRRILVTGLGSIGQRHARNLRTLYGDDVEILAWRLRRSSPLLRADMTAEPTDDLEGAYGIRAFSKLDEALAEEPEAVFVTNPPDMHVPTALAAVEAGAHVLIEKPLSHDLDGVDELVAAIEWRQRVSLVGYQLRFHPGYRLLKRLVDDGALGTLLGARFCFGEYMPAWHPWEDYREGNAARADQGGGVVLAQIHDLDVAVALFGPPRRVFGVGGSRSSLGLAVEDVAGILLDCDGVPVQLHQDVVQRPPVRTYQVIGEAARATWDYYADTVRIERANGEDEVVEFAGFERNDLFLAELRHFFACVAGVDEPVVDARAGLESLRVALAVKRSLASGEATPLP
jgi:predicted dehydrogenase